MIIAIGKIEVSNLIKDIIEIASGNNEIHEKNKFSKFVHAEGWGIAYLDLNDEWHACKSITPIFKDEKIYDFLDIQAKILVLHVRKATRGAKRWINNNQPFILNTEKGKFLFAHNGSIDDELYTKEQYKLHSDSDSSKYFSYILSSADYESLESIKESIKKLKRFTSANFILVTPNKVIVGERYAKDPDYYTMKLYRDNEKTIVSSEILPTLKDKEWKPLDNMSLIEIPINR